MKRPILSDLHAKTPLSWLLGQFCGLKLPQFLGAACVGDMRGAREPHERRQQQENAASEKKRVVQAEERRLGFDELLERSLRHRGREAGSLKLGGQRVQQIERSEAPSAEMVAVTKFMPGAPTKPATNFVAGEK